MASKPLRRIKILTKSLSINQRNVVLLKGIRAPPERDLIEWIEQFSSSWMYVLTVMES
jgi:hypothetical protein